MRSTLIVTFLVVAAAISGSAQDTPKGPMLPGGSKVTADQMQSSSPREMIFSGNVTVVLSEATVTADRAIFHQSSQTFDLEGHVQLKPNPPTK
jgi:lipopolysaccharide assembly outer membrane protein LptD (OstA)